ncbi:hypothetical protein A2U01_0102598, partial [Trifolium medium]|nr:hypothetical protein [Trifolium medium]
MKASSLPTGRDHIVSEEKRTMGHISSKISREKNCP